MVVEHDLYHAGLVSNKDVFLACFQMRVPVFEMLDWCFVYVRIFCLFPILSFRHV